MKSRSWLGWFGVGGLVLAAWGPGTGCAASEEVFVEQDDDGGAGQGGDRTSGTPSVGGGATTGGDGGDGGEDIGPCAQDCSTFTTPPCFRSVCNEGLFPGPIGQCVVVPEDAGTSCDDEQFCTVDDTCDGSGVCVGGPANTCGMTPETCQEITCDEATDTCGMGDLPNGTACTSTDLCLQGATCVAGACTGGVPNDCFFAPVPSECFVAVCDPADGMCKPQVGNEGGACVDPNDLCTDNKTCAAGTCQGGSPKDCSQLTQGCVNGECDITTGLCAAVPVPAGGSCQAAVDQCNAGVCDMNGNCQPSPVADGTPCNDGQICTATDTCQSGVCTGGSPITQCVAGDFCCPAGCNGGNDNDCNIVTVTLDAVQRGWWNASGSHTATNNNTITGRTSTEYNSYFAFDLTSLSGQTVISAELRLELEGHTGMAMQDISIWDVSTPTNTLEASGSNQVAIFQDLQSGNQYASLSGLLNSQVGQVLVMPLGPAAITDLQSKVGTNNFAVGVHNESAATATGTNWVRFSSAGEVRTHQLVLEVL